VAKIVAVLKSKQLKFIEDCSFVGDCPFAGDCSFVGDCFLCTFFSLKSLLLKISKQMISLNKRKGGKIHFGTFLLDFLFVYANRNTLFTIKQFFLKSKIVQKLLEPY
jgi:hypothetical protein